MKVDVPLNKETKLFYCIEEVYTGIFLMTLNHLYLILVLYLLDLPVKTNEYVKRVQFYVNDFFFFLFIDCFV